MRKIISILIFILIIIFFVGCKKKDSIPTQEEIQKRKEQIWAEIEKDSPENQNKDSVFTGKNKDVQNIRDSLNIKEAKDSDKIKEMDKQDSVSNVKLVQDKKTSNNNKAIYKVQVFSATNMDYAEKISNELYEKVGIKPYIKKRKNFYRIIFGNFENKKKAIEIKNKCIALGYKDAYILIQKPGNYDKEKTSNRVVNDNEKGYFTIQIGSFSRLENADRLSKEVKRKVGKECYIVKIKGLYKVFTGKYMNHKDAEKELENIKSYYKDAFIIKR